MVDLIHQTENSLNPLIGQRLVSVFEHAELGIAEDELQNALELVTAPGLFTFDQLCHRDHIFFLHVPKIFQSIPECTGEGVEHTVFNIAVLQHVCDMVRGDLGHLHILVISLEVSPEVRFPPQIRGGQRGRTGIPASQRQTVVIGLGSEKVREEHMAQFVANMPVTIW